MGQVPLGVQAQTGTVYMIKPAERAFSSLNLLTTVSTDVPDNSKGETSTSRRNRFSFPPMSARLTHRCLSVATISAIEDLSITAAVCLVALRAKSAVRRNSVTASGGSPWLWSRSFSKSAWFQVCFIVNSTTCTVHTYRELKLRYSQTLGAYS